MKFRNVLRIAALLALGLTSTGATAAELLNASYDSTRSLYADINQAFSAQWQRQGEAPINILESYGSSGQQARSVIGGVQADVVTLALAPDVDAIAEHGLIDSAWQKRLPNHSTPFTSTIVLLVRKGNPKNIKDWNDLTRPDIAIVTANPKTSGGARWGYLAAWGYALAGKGDAEQARSFVTALYQNVKHFADSVRAAAQVFAAQGVGDVLITWENEAHETQADYSDAGLQIVVPSRSILAEPTVAVIDRNVDKKGTRRQAEAYLSYLYTQDAQLIAVNHHFRPTAPAVVQATAGRFPTLELFRIDDVFGGWQEAQRIHFASGGIFDQIVADRAVNR